MSIVTYLEENPGVAAFLLVSVTIFPLVIFGPRNVEAIELYIGSLVTFFLGLVYLYRGINDYKRTTLIRDTSTETVNALSIGRTELTGTAVPDEHIVERPFSDGVCLCAAYEIEVHNGGNGPKWVPETSGVIGRPFLLDDGTGTVSVEPDDSLEITTSAELSHRVVASKLRGVPSEIRTFCSFTDDQTDERRESWPPDEVLDAEIDIPKLEVVRRDDHDVEIGTEWSKRRFTEHVIPVGMDVYLFGRAETGSGSDLSLRITEDTSSGEFIISDYDYDRAVASNYHSAAIKQIVAGGVLSTVGLGFWLWSLGAPFA